MVPINSQSLLDKLQQWLGINIYLHIEINPGGYYRNGKATLSNVHVKGDRSFRVFLEMDQQQSIIQVDDLTHMSISEELVVISGYDHVDRLARTLEISSNPFVL
jgi:hypothetical protein